MDLGQPERFPVPALEGLPIIGDGLPILAIIVIITSYYDSELLSKEKFPREKVIKKPFKNEDLLRVIDRNL